VTGIAQDLDVSVPGYRSAIAVIRAWKEGANGERLTIRISMMDDIAASERRGTAVTTIDDAVAVVRQWLQAVSVARVQADDGTQRPPARKPPCP
jgi:hypothetical protein